MQFGVAMLTRPEIERNGCQFVYERLGAPIFREIDALNICLAGVARLDPNVIEFASREHREMLVVLLAASRTNDPPKLPFGEAEGTNHRSRTPIAQRAQHTENRLSIAERT